jgi:serine/threonine protein kinase
MSNNIDKELKIINLLKGKYNENLVSVHYANYLKDQTEFIIIMDKCETDLEKVMKIQPNKKFTEIDAIQIMRQIFNGYA